MSKSGGHPTPIQMHVQRVSNLTQEEVCWPARRMIRRALEQASYTDKLPASRGRSGASNTLAVRRRLWRLPSRQTASPTAAETRAERLRRFWNDGDGL